MKYLKYVILTSLVKLLKNPFEVAHAFYSFQPLIHAENTVKDECADQDEPKPENL